MNLYSEQLDRWSNMATFDYYYSNRKWLALMRLGLYNFMLRRHFGFNEV